MPFLKFKGIKPNDVEVYSEEIIAIFSKNAEIEKRKVKLECIAIDYSTEHPPSIEVVMFERKKVQKNNIANELYALFQKLGYQDIHILFVIITRENYYINGTPIENMGI